MPTKRLVRIRRGEGELSNTHGSNGSPNGQPRKRKPRPRKVHEPKPCDRCGDPNKIMIFPFRTCDDCKTAHLKRYRKAYGRFLIGTPRHKLRQWLDNARRRKRRLTGILNTLDAEITKAEENFKSTPVSLKGKIPKIDY